MEDTAECITLAGNLCKSTHTVSQPVITQIRHTPYLDVLHLSFICLIKYHFQYFSIEGIVFILEQLNASVSWPFRLVAHLKKKNAEWDT